jgi:hypothetical protein
VPARVYVQVFDANGAIVARLYVDGDDVPAWLARKAGCASVRCDVFDAAPQCGGKKLTTFVPKEGRWEERVT